MAHDGATEEEFLSYSVGDSHCKGKHHGFASGVGEQIIHRPGEGGDATNGERTDRKQTRKQGSGDEATEGVDEHPTSTRDPVVPEKPPGTRENECGRDRRRVKAWGGRRGERRCEQAGGHE